MSENNVRITRAGQSIRDYLMGKRTRDDLEGKDMKWFISNELGRLRQIYNKLLLIIL